jgi:hypothetical protein
MFDSQMDLAEKIWFSAGVIFGLSLILWGIDGITIDGSVRFWGDIIYIIGGFWILYSTYRLDLKGERR